jgi:hypothetical protein
VFSAKLFPVDVISACPSARLGATTVLVAASVLIASRTAPGQSQPPTGSPTRNEQPADRATAQPTQIRQEARELVSIVAKLRGLSPKREVLMGVMSRREIMSEVRKRLARDYSEAEVLNETAILRRLGLLARHVDYKQAILALLTDQLAGFYDPDTRRLNVARWLPLPLQRPTLAHEICHALQDHHFDLKRFVKPNRENGDRQLARAALVEGDCTGVMLEYVLAPSGVDLQSASGAIDQLIRGMLGSGSPAFRRAPRFLRETLTFPYLYGLKLIKDLRKTSGWSAVDRLFARPPTTTEQLLHHDKLVKRERPRNLRVAPLPALATYRQIKRDVLGEFQLRLLLEQAVEPAVAAAAASGWDGDRLVAYRQSNQSLRSLPLLVHASSWDTERDAMEFAEASEPLLQKLTATAGSSAIRESTVRIYRDRDQLEWSLQRKGSRVLLLVAVPPALRSELQRQVWQRWRL